MSEAETKGTGGPARPLPAAEAGFDAVGLARELLRTVRSGALATLEPDGTPFASLVTIATDSDGTPLMLLSRLSAHTRNLLADPRCSLLFSAGGKGDPLAHPRLTVVGRAATFLVRQPAPAGTVLGVRHESHLVRHRFASSRLTAVPTAAARSNVVVRLPCKPRFEFCSNLT